MHGMCVRSVYVVSMCVCVCGEWYVRGVCVGTCMCGYVHTCVHVSVFVVCVCVHMHKYTCV